MNKDQVKGSLKKAEGKVQETVGKVVDSPSQRAKGLKKQVDGTVQKAIGDLKEAAHDIRSR